jgi:hypothetical protein
VWTRVRNFLGMALPANSTDALGAASVEAEGTSQGFAIRLPTAQLADLIQINCLNRVRGVFRVSSGVDEGHLWFAGGQLVHADFDGAIGLDAVVMMLGLRGGSIEPCEQPWPALSTIDMGADALLLSAAQRLDESGERRSDPGRDLTTKVVRRAHLAPSEEQEFPANDAGPARSSLSPPASSGLQHLALAQLSVDGTVQKLRGGATAELADTAFYSLQVAGLVGDALGLGACQALAFEGREESIVVFRGRSITGVRGSNADLVFVRAKVGLP